MIPLIKFLLVLIILLIPLLDVASLGYEQTKIIFFLVGISLTGFIWLLSKPKIKWNLIKLASAVFLMILLFGSMFGLDLKSSLLGQPHYYQGWIIYAYLGLFSLIVAESQMKIKDWAVVLTVSAALVAVLAIRQWVAVELFHLPIPTYAGRVVATFGQPNFYAGFLLLTLPFSYYLFKNYPLSSPRKRGSINNWILGYFGIISGLISVIGIFVSYSRSAILMALLLLALGLINQLKIRLRVGLIVLVIVSISIFLAWKFSSGLVGNEVSNPILTKNPDLTRESVEKRVYIWPEAVKIALQNPLTGYGLDNIGPAFANYFAVNKHSLFEENLNIRPVLISLKELNIDRSHNYLLDLLLFSGIFGLLGWLGLLRILFWKLKNTRNPSAVGKNVLMVALVTYIIWVQFQNQSIVHLVYFWLLVGLIDRT